MEQQVSGYNGVEGAWRGPLDGIREQQAAKVFHDTTSSINETITDADSLIRDTDRLLG